VYRTKEAEKQPVGATFGGLSSVVVSISSGPDHSGIACSVGCALYLSKQKFAEPVYAFWAFHADPDPINQRSGRELAGA
jgi:hypothetical protein